MQKRVEQIRTNKPAPFFSPGRKRVKTPFAAQSLHFLFLILFLFPLAATAQKLKQSDYDTVKKQWHIESFPVTLKTGPGVKMDLSLTSTEAAPLTLRLAGSGTGANTVLTGDNLIFLLDDDSTVTAKSPTVQDVARGSNTYSHDYVLLPADLQILARHNLQAVRKYSTEGYDDVSIESGNAGKLKEASTLFLEELQRKTVVPSTPAAVQAGFPGGTAVLLGFLNRNLKIMPAFSAGERRYSQVQFSIRPDGAVSDVSIAYSAGEVFDKELLRIWRRMPKWKPALQAGEKVEATVIQPLTFVQTGNGVQVRF